MNGQMNIFDLTMPEIKIDKPIRLIELFGGYGSQAMALDVIGADYEHYRLVEFDKYAIMSYNAVHGTDFKTTDIRDVHGSDLGICDTDSYTYIMTYSFPCTDLSVAGKMQGMSKGSGTRSGLLWEVERILQEIADAHGELPQILFMENVPQVISPANIDDFHSWQSFLTKLGYTNHVQILNAKDYGVAQNRERAFMFSFLGELNYKFPEPIPLTKTMKDYLEDEVPEKYYINTEKAQKLIEKLIESGDLQGCVGNINPSGNGLNGSVYAGDIAPTLATNKGEGQKICVDLSIKNPSENNIANCITSRENRGISNQQSVGNGVVSKVAIRLGNILDDKYGSGYAGNVWDKNACCPTLQTMQGGGRESMIIELGRPNSSQDGIVVDSRGISKTLTAGNNNQPKIVEVKRLNTKDENGKQPPQQERVYDTSGIMTSILAEQGGRFNILEENHIARMIGRNPDNPTDRTAGAPTEQGLEPNSQGICNAITTVQKDNMVLVRQATKDGYIECKLGGVTDLSYPSSQTRRGRVQDNGDTSPTITATETGVCRIETRYRIRKLTPRECGRLMDVSDSNIDKMLSVVSNSQAYKQFGNSIVVNVMVAMFSNLNIQGLPRWNEIKDR